MAGKHINIVVHFIWSTARFRYATNPRPDGRGYELPPCGLMETCDA